MLHKVLFSTQTKTFPKIMTVQSQNRSYIILNDLFQIEGMEPLSSCVGAAVQ